MRACRTPAAPVKRLRSRPPRDEIIRRFKKPVQPLVYSDDGEDAADVSKPKAVSDIIRRIWAVKSRQEPHVAATGIK